MTSPVIIFSYFCTERFKYETWVLIIAAEKIYSTLQKVNVQKKNSISHFQFSIPHSPFPIPRFSNIRSVIFKETSVSVQKLIEKGLNRGNKANFFIVFSFVFCRKARVALQEKFALITKKALRFQSSVDRPNTSAIYLSLQEQKLETASNIQEKAFKIPKTISDYKK